MTIKNIKDIYISNETAKQLADKYGVTMTTIYNILNGKTYSKTTKHLMVGKTGAGLKDKKLKDDKIKEIFLATTNLQDTAKLYGVKYSTVKNIRTGVIHGDVTNGLTRGVTEFGPTRKIKDSDIINIFKSEESFMTLAKKYGISSNYIYAIKKGHKYKELTKDLV